VFLTRQHVSALDRFFAAADAIGRKTYQHGLGVALADDPVARRLAELQTRRGRFRGVRPVARRQPLRVLETDIGTGDCSPPAFRGTTRRTPISRWAPAC
jgi:hypothetical protein